MRTRRSLRAAALGMTLTGAVLGGCTSDAQSGNDPAGPTPSAPTATPLDAVDEFVPMAPGEYVMRFLGSGADTQPWAVIQMTSDEFSHNGAFIISDGPAADFRAIGLWTVAEVSVNPCYGTTREWVTPGPTVADLAAALAAQPLKSGTQPVPVSLGGYDGLFVQTTVPEDVPVTDCIDDSFVSWQTDLGQVRRHGGSGEVDRLWILDVEGHRLVVGTTHNPATSAEQIAELTSIVESVTFTNTAS